MSSGRSKQLDIVDEAWSQGSYRMEVWMTGATARSIISLPDPDLMILGEADGTVRVLDEKSRGPTSVEKKHEGLITSLSPARAGSSTNLFVSAGVDGQIILWRESKLQKRHFEVAHKVQFLQDTNKGEGDKQAWPVRVFTLQRGNRVVAFSGHQETMEVFDVVNKSEGFPVLMHLFYAKGHKKGVKFAQGELDQVVSIDSEDTLRLWSTKTRSVEMEIAKGCDSGRISAMHLRGRTAILGRDDGVLDIWDLLARRKLHSIQRHNGKITHVTSVGNVVISAAEEVKNDEDEGDCVRFCDLKTGRLLSSFTTRRVTCMALRTSPQKSKEFVLTGHTNGKSIVWDVEDQRSMHILDGHHKTVRSIYANRLCGISGGEDSTCRVWRFADQFVLKREQEQLEKQHRKAEECSNEGKQAYSSRRFKEAIRLYSEAIGHDPTEFKYYTNRAAAYLETGAYQECIADCQTVIQQGEELDEATDLTPAQEMVFAKAYARRGKALEKLGQVEEAIKSLELSLEMIQDQQDIEKLLKELKGKGGEAEDERKKGGEAYRKKEFDVALQHYTNALQFQPESPRNWANRAAVQLEMGDQMSSIADCDKAICLLRNRDDQELLVRVLIRKGNALCKAERIQEAVSAFSESLTLKPDPDLQARVRDLAEDPNKHKMRGNEMFKARRYKDAIVHYDKAILCDGKQYSYIMNRAVALSEMKNFNMAANDFEKAAELARLSSEDGAFVRVMQKKSRMLERKASDANLKKHEKKQILNEALESLRAGMNDSCTSAERKAELSKSITGIEASLSWMRMEDNVKEEIANGDRMFADGQYAAAVKFYDKAVALDPECKTPNSYLLYSARGGCNLEMNRQKQALSDAKRCIQLNPAWHSGHMLEARVFEVMEDWNQMMTCCLRAYDLKPDDETNLAMLRDCLVKHLSSDKLQRERMAGWSDAMGRMHNDSETKELLKDPKIRRVLEGMQMQQSLKPLVDHMEDLPFIGRFCKVYASGLLLDGRKF